MKSGNPPERVTNTVSSVAFGTNYFKASGDFDLLFYGAGLGTVSIEKSIIDPAGSPEWKEIQEYTADGTPQDYPAYEPALAWYRIGFSAHTSGETVFVFSKISRGIS